MGKKAKTSRKGKKAWRANISTEDIGDFYEKSTKDALSGGSVANLDSESLFFVDKTRDLSVKRKIEKHREKALKYETVLQKNPFVHAVPSSTRKKSKSKAIVELNKAAQNSAKAASSSDSLLTDLWEGEYTGKVKKMSHTSVIPAVEIEPPGCSFNPSFDSHQDSLARAVADEMQKVFKEELGPEPVPLTVVGQAVDEEDMYFLDAAADGSDDDMSTENLIDGESQPLEKRSFKVKPVTRVELNKRARRKETLKKEAETKKVQQLSKEIDSVSKIMKEIEKEDVEKQKRHLRRVVANEERLKSRPPRLGKHKFEPAPMQVLLSEEITGSMRQLKGCCTLAKDRFKSLEKRGIIVPTGKKKNSRG